jgi:dTDP-4-dehydrorhamnose 3,5-epimerase
MPYHQTHISGLWIFEPKVIQDERGFFYESFNHRNFVEATAFTGHFVQDNHSLSAYGVMRGLHCQLPPHDQSKLVRTIKGTILDVAVDARTDSPTYKKYFSVVLSAENKKQLFIPKGFLHGFVVLSEDAELLYKCDHYYAPSAEAGVIYNDSELGIDWQIPEEDMIISEKDLKLKPLVEAMLTF